MGAVQSLGLGHHCRGYSNMSPSASIPHAMADMFLVEVGGYIARCLSIHNQDSKTLYIVKYVLVGLAPVLMAAACYVVFVCSPSRLAVLLGTNGILQGPIVFHVVPKEQRTLKLKLLWISRRFPDYNLPHTTDKTQLTGSLQSSWPSTSISHTPLFPDRHPLTLPLSRASGPAHRSGNHHKHQHHRRERCFQSEKGKDHGQNRRHPAARLLRTLHRHCCALQLHSQAVRQ